MTGVTIAHTEHNNRKALEMFAGKRFARCIDVAHHTCTWHCGDTSVNAPVPGPRQPAVDHVAREGHVVAVIEDGVVTTLVPSETTPKTTE